MKCQVLFSYLMLILLFGMIFFLFSLCKLLIFHLFIHQLFTDYHKPYQALGSSSEQDLAQK